MLKRYLFVKLGLWIWDLGTEIDGLLVTGYGLYSVNCLLYTANSVFSSLFIVSAGDNVFSVRRKSFSVRRK